MIVLDRLIDFTPFQALGDAVGNNEISLAYMYLKDPGGQVITPRDLWSQDN